MKRIHYITSAILGSLILLLVFSNLYIGSKSEVTDSVNINDEQAAAVERTSQKSITPTPSPIMVPERHVIPIRKHMFQTFNNCGPASLSMQLSYYNIDVSQQVLGNYLRPRQNPQGINDDKTVSLNELAKYAEDNYDFTVYQRPGGDMEMLKQLIANDIPVVVRSWLELGDDIGHYRLIRGYDDNRRVIIQDDSYQDKNLEISYDEFEQMWMPFSWEFMVLAKNEQIGIIESILGNVADEKQAWRKSLENSNPDDPLQESRFAIFNQSRANYHLGNYERSIELYESVASDLPMRMLWYQYEPILAYLQTERYDRVFSMTSNILNNNNLAYSELYIIRGKAYQAQGQLELARQEFEKAALYNQNLEEPKRLLAQFEGN